MRRLPQGASQKTNQAHLFCLAKLTCFPHTLEDQAGLAVLFYGCSATPECPGIGETPSCFVQSAEKAICDQQKGLEKTPHHSHFTPLLQSSHRLTPAGAGPQPEPKIPVYPSFLPARFPLGLPSGLQQQWAAGAAGPHKKCPPFYSPC